MILTPFLLSPPARFLSDFHDVSLVLCSVFFGDARWSRDEFHEAHTEIGQGMKFLLVFPVSNLMMPLHESAGLFSFGHTYRFVAIIEYSTKLEHRRRLWSRYTLRFGVDML